MPATPKPIGYDSLTLSSADLTTLCDQFQLKEPVELTPILKTGDRQESLRRVSSTSHKLVLTSGDEQFFLKRIPWYACSTRQLRFSTSLQRHLIDRQIPIPMLRSTRSGQWWAVVGGSPFTMSTLVQGYRQQHLPVEFSAAGQMLAEMHDAGASLQETALHESPWQLARDHLKIAQAAQRQEQSLENIRALEELDALLGISARELLDHGYAELPPQAVHGDYSAENLLFTSDRMQVAAVVDFDNCDTDSRLHDVVEGALARCWIHYRAHSTHFHSLSASVDLAVAHQFVSSYDRASPLTAREWRCVPGVVLAFVVETISLGLIRRDVSAASVLETLRYFRDRRRIAELVEAMRA